MASSPPSTRTVIENVSIVDGGALDCSACYSPLKPPVFQCDVGHLVCSLCSEKMAGARRCHVCRRVLDGGGYRPCYGVDRILGCLQVPCANAGYGCPVRLAHHDQRAHLLQASQHGPCHCPAEACAFVGSVTALWDHFSAAHRWPCTTAVLSGGENGVHLRDGFSVVNLVRGDGSYLLLMRGFPDQRAVSAICFHRSMH